VDQDWLKNEEAPAICTQLWVRPCFLTLKLRSSRQGRLKLSGSEKKNNCSLQTFVSLSAICLPPAPAQLTELFLLSSAVGLIRLSPHSIESRLILAHMARARTQAPPRPPQWGTGEREEEGEGEGN